MNNYEIQKIIAKLTAQAWGDVKVWAQLLKDPKPLLAECGATGEALEIKFVEEVPADKTSDVVMLPAKPQGFVAESVNLHNDTKNLLANYTPQTPSSSSGGQHPAPSMDLKVVFEESSDAFYVGSDPIEGDSILLDKAATN